MSLFEELSWRGFINQVTHPELAEKLEKESMTLYCGFDPTADSLHIGSLLPIMGLVHFQRAGHKPIALVGGGTGLIGDPSFKAVERQLLTKEQVEINLQGIRKQLERFIDFSGANAAIAVNNGEWLCELPLIDFLRDIGKHFSVNVMMSRESVRQRINDREHGMSFTEFSYSLLQSYDFLYLYDQYACRLQIGGSDQWGNIVSGMDLTRRLRGAETYGLTFPLVTKADGSKFGKSESGNVWLDARRTSPFKFYQFWLNQADADVPRYLRYFTLLSREEIEALDKLIETEPEKRLAQKRLAEEITRMTHGDEALQNALRATEAVFGGDITGLDDETLEDVFSEVPSAVLPRSILSENKALVDVLADASVVGSKGEAKRLIKDGGLYLNNRRVESDQVKVDPSILCSERIAIIRRGKKSYHLLKFVD